MNIQLVRFLNCILTLVFVFVGKYYLITYIAINQVLLEILNAQPIYKTQFYKLYNTIFWAYELVLVERLRHFKMNTLAEWWLNNLEHIFFAMVISLLLYILLAIFWLKSETKRLQRLVITIILFNAIGLINEWLQNLMAKRAAFVLLEDGVKDLKMNLMGSCIFILTAICRLLWLAKKSNA